jgi:hypothetical protein
MSVGTDQGQCTATLNLSAPVSDNCAYCPNGAAISGYTYKGKFDGHDYYVSNSGATWPDANAAAKALGGHLAAIGSAAENNFVASTVAGGGLAWIGFTDEGGEGTYYWTSGQPVTYTNWCSGEPNNFPPGEDHTVINWCSGGGWNDWYATEVNPFVVEFDCLKILGPSGPTTFPTGTTTVTYSATDGSGNTATCSFTVTVTDDDPPTITKPANIGACNGAVANNHYTLTATAVDACSSTASLSWVAKDQNNATLGSGSGGTATANFPVGVNTVTWTATDGTNSGSASATVTIWSLPTVTVPDVVIGCKSNIYYDGYGLTLTAGAANGTPPYTYRWTPPASNTYTSNASYNLPGAGTYTVSVKDAHGCISPTSASATKTITYKDARCGNKLDKVMVCHNTGSNNNPNNAICISPNAVPAHIANHGDCLGDCTSAFAKGTAVNRLDLEGGTIAVFPNPAHSSINVELKDGGSFYRFYQITDISGRVVLSRQLSGEIRADLITVDVSTFVPGVYVIRAVTDDGASTAKFIVQ